MVGVATLVLLLFLGAAVPVAASLGVLGVILSYIFGPMPLTRAVGEISWSTSNEFIILAVPLYILMGEVLMRSGIAERMYNGMVQWLSWLPGGLMHATIGFSAMFAATSGSSVATAATIGTVAIPEIKRYRYHEPLFLGTLAAGGTLGILIPPSVNLILYGVLTNTSIPDLYLAGFIPGFMLAGFFMVVVIVVCLFRPAWGGVPVKTDWDARLRALIDFLPPLFIFLMVVGTIYAGFATPTESAALGLVSAFLLAALRKRLTWDVLRRSVEGCVRTTAMCMAILLAAFFLNFVISVIGLTGQLNNLITDLGLGPYGTLFVVIAFLVILGCFMETLSMMVATVPIITPVMVGLGFDPVWFGIIVVLLIEMAMITPPVGINLYVIQSLRAGGEIKDVIHGAMYFLSALAAMIGLLIAFPQVAMFLPNLFR